MDTVDKIFFLLLGFFAGFCVGFVMASLRASVLMLQDTFLMAEIQKWDTLGQFQEEYY